MTVEERVEAIIELGKRVRPRLAKDEATDDIELEIEKIKDGIEPNKAWDYNRLYNKRLLEESRKDYEELLWMTELSSKADCLQSTRRFWLQWLYTHVLELAIERFAKTGRGQEEFLLLTRLDPTLLTSNPSVFLPEDWRDDPELCCCIMLGATLEEFEVDLLSSEEREQWNALLSEIELSREAKDENKIKELREKRKKLLPRSSCFSLDFWLKLYDIEKNLLEEMAKKAEQYDAAFASQLKDATLTTETMEQFMAFLIEKQYGITPEEYRSLKVKG